MSILYPLLNDKGDYNHYTFPGCYPIYYVTKDAGKLCSACANKNKHLTFDPFDPQWFIVGTDANWENPNMICDNCNERIESAYAED